MKELNDKEWKEFQKSIKNLKENVPGANVSAAVLIINLNNDYSNIIFDN